jgi:SAM-dependent methyltransferase
MHTSSYEEMRNNIDKYFGKASGEVTGPFGGEGVVVDVGSMDVMDIPCSYRTLFEPRFRYIGVDIEPGRNVDLVMPSEFNTGLPDRFADVVISGQCLEHCRNPFRLVKEMFRIANGYVFITAPWSWEIHRYPVDCWRILPDGMKELIEQGGGDFAESYIVDRDTWGIGRAI